MPTFRSRSRLLRIALLSLLLFAYGFVASSHNHAARAGNSDLCAVCVYGLDTPAPQPFALTRDAAPMIGAAPASYGTIHVANPFARQPHNRGPPTTC